MLAVLIMGAGARGFPRHMAGCGFWDNNSGCWSSSDFNMMCLAETHVVEYQFLIKT